VLTIVGKLIERKLVKQQWANFIAAWSSSIVRKAWNRFHHNFKANMQADPFGYKGVNLGSTTFA
jgi:hypothetical protein